MRWFLNKKILLSLVALAAGLLAGCQSLNEPDAGNLASVEITGQPLAVVQTAITNVFTANAFIGGPTGPNEFSYLRPGSRMDQAAYGSYMFQRPIMVKVEVTTTARPPDTIVVGCKAWIVEEDSDPVMQENHKIGFFGRGTYENLLKQVQQQAQGK
jgi:hypothetical protein